VGTAAGEAVSSDLDREGIVGAIFAGAVQDMVTLFFSMRRPLIPDDLAVMDPQMFNENPDGRH
jgi:hypothetical protein